MGERRISWRFVLTLFLFVCGQQGAEAATLSVCPSGCDSPTIQGANTLADPGDTIQILSSQPHTEGDIFLTKNLTIEGFGSSLTIVQADTVEGVATVPIFVVMSGARITISDLTIRYGGGLNGGGVRILDGDVVLTDVTVTHNEANQWGGGIFVEAGSSLKTIRSKIAWNTATGGKGGGVHSKGTVEMTGSSVHSNHSNGPYGSAYGGGIASSGSLSLKWCSVQDNLVSSAGADHDARGGGVYFDGSNLLIEDSVFIVNSATSEELSWGGGLDAVGTGSATVRRTSFRLNNSWAGGGINSTISGLEVEASEVRSNTATTFGGGVGLSGPARIVDSTVAGNSAIYGGGVGVISALADPVVIVNSTLSGNAATEHGGGLYADSGVTKLANATIAENSADEDADNNGSGGGIFVQSAVTVELSNTLVANNLDKSTYSWAVAKDCAGTLQSAGYNLIRSLSLIVVSCTISGDTTGNLVRIDPLLQALNDNGGPTETHRLGTGSPAINAGNPAGCTDPDGSPLPADQRGGVRTNRCDIGAFERGAVIPEIFSDGFEWGNTFSWSSKVP